MGSVAEQEIRDAVVARLRDLLPTARIIHELNVAGQGTNRMDLAAVTRDTIIGVELKSEKDKLDRLADQWSAFDAACHHVVVAVHRKFFEEFRPDYRREDLPALLRIDHPLWRARPFREAVWCYPLPHLELDETYRLPGWQIDQRQMLARPQPHAATMLDMLWRAELAAECDRHGIANSRRSKRSDMIRDMAWMLPGRDVCHAACRQLRARTFAEADPPIFDERHDMEAT